MSATRLHYFRVGAYPFHSSGCTGKNLYCRRTFPGRNVAVFIWTARMLTGCPQRRMVSLPERGLVDGVGASGIRRENSVAHRTVRGFTVRRAGRGGYVLAGVAGGGVGEGASTVGSAFAIASNAWRPSTVVVENFRTICAASGLSGVTVLARMACRMSTMERSSARACFSKLSTVPTSPLSIAWTVL